MMEWENEKPKPTSERSTLDGDDIRITIERKVSEDRNWQYFGLVFSEYSQRDHEACQMQWPRQAIATARKRLDEFEAELNKDLPCEEP